MLNTPAKWLSILLGIGGFVLCQPSRADWDYTRWGMTADQVLSASKGQLRKCSPTVCRAHATTTSSAQLYGEFHDGTFSFTVFAFFEHWSGRLSSLELWLWDVNQTDAVVKAMLTKYGEPARNSNGAIIESYVWRSSIDQITLLAVRDRRASTTITYRPGDAP
jgi:hypothetical protein